jgi:hypothetical protein
VSRLLQLLAVLCAFHTTGGRPTMGYDVHITRASDWTESAAHPISLDEWVGYVSSDSEMRLDNRAEATTTSGDDLAIESPGIAVWTAWRSDGVRGNHAWFYYFDGEIMVKNPDREILRKMYRIAVALKARVQGDEGEFYDADGRERPD